MNRRSLFAALLAPFVSSCVANRSAAEDDGAGDVMMSRTFHYGPNAGNVGDMYLPPDPRPRVVCLLHGGFWRMPYGRDQMSPIAADLCRRGLAVWNIGYRRIGEPDVGWPEISADVVAALEFLHDFSEREHDLDLSEVVVVGHSAGGQLALACTSLQARGEHEGSRGRRIRPAAVVALAALTDLEDAFASNVGNGAARALLGGAPAECPDRYASASPIRLLPHGASLLLLHGTNDEDVPIAQSRRYARAAGSAGDDVSYFELEGTDHMAFLDPRSSAHASLCNRLQGRWRT